MDTVNSSSAASTAGHRQSEPRPRLGMTPIVIVCQVAALACAALAGVELAQANWGMACWFGADGFVMSAVMVRCFAITDREHERYVRGAIRREIDPWNA